jgi:serine/threonine-protein kinase
MGDEREELIVAARAMAARLPVDWNSLELSASDESLRAAVHELRVIAEIADLHRRPLDTCSPAVLSSTTSSIATAEIIGSRGPTPNAAADLAWGPFTLVEPIGHGSSAEVYRAWDPRLDREIALKLLWPGTPGSQASAHLVIEEGRLLARVRHPNVVTVYGADRIEGRVGVWMEFIHGRTLEVLLREQGPLAPDQVVRIGVEICRALSAVHQAGLLHRDIKAQNVMCDEAGRLVLMDFGAGLEVQEGSSGTDIAGTPLYLASELFAGGITSVQSDLYAVGVLLYHLLTGNYPVAGRTMSDIRAQHQLHKRVSVRNACMEMPDQLARAIDRSLEIDPAARFPNADAMAAALEASIASATTPSGRRGLALAAAGVVMAAIIGTLVFKISRSSSSIPNRPGDAITSVTAPGVSPADRSFAVRRVLLPGEYSEIGRPSSDGRYFPFIDNDSELAVKELATGRTVRLTHRDSSDDAADGAAAISADAHWIAYTWLTADHAFELRVLPVHDPSGVQPRTLIHSKDIEVYPVDWSESGDRILAIIEHADLKHEVAMIEAADGAVQPLAAAPTSAQGFSLSPDGRFVVYAVPQRDNPRVRDIHVLPTDGGGEWPLVEHPANDLFPLWAPDGNKIFFASDRTGALGLWSIRVVDGHPVGDAEVVSGNMGLMNPLGVTRDGAFYYHLRTGLVDAYTVSVDPILGAGKPQPVAPNYVGSNISSTWAPDGRHLAYVSIRSAARADRYSRTLSIRDMETGAERDVWPALAFFIMPQWSPDGRTIAVRGNGLQGQCCLQLIDVASGRVTHIALADGQATGHYQWTDGGRSIIFARRDVIMKRDVSSGHEIELLNPRTIVDRLTPPPFGRPFEVSPDGRSVAFSGWIGEGDTAQTVLEVVPFGRAPVEIARSHSKAPMFFQGWTPDGQEIFFTQPAGDKGSTTVLWQISAAGGQPRRVGVEMVGLRDVHVNRDGTRLTFTGGSEIGEVRVMENFLSP